MFSRMGSAAFKKDLHNIRILCNRLDNPQEKFKTIHVGGTNGKGSVSHMLSAIFQSSGYKTGLYTSPHLYDFRERIRIDGQEISEVFVTGFVDKIKPLIAEIEPSFFEITVAMAFEYFAQEKVDIAIIEVGLGGRLDSTNIITPILSVITNIGWDHMNMLGDTLEKIAGEKAGIIKENIPVVVGETTPGTKLVFEKTAEIRRSPLYFAEDFYTHIAHSWSGNHLQITIREKKVDKNIEVETDLTGLYQTRNICTVLTALKVLEKLYPGISSNALPALTIVKQLTGLKGRWDILRTKPTVILEVAHNKEGIEQMLQHLQELKFDKLHLVMGIVKDKDADTILKLLPSNAHYYFSQAHIPRALPSGELKEKAGEFSLNGGAYSNVNLALEAALNNASADDLVRVCGSIFLVAEVERSIAQLI